MINVTRAAGVCLLAAILVMAGCESNVAGPSGPDGGPQVLGASSFSNVTGRGFIWVDGELFRTVATPAHFKPRDHAVDVLYTSGPNASFRDGYSISEAGPGDTDYNGGRWHVMVLKNSVDPNKYANADSDSDLDPADFESTGVFFLCPLQPIR